VAVGTQRTDSGDCSRAPIVDAALRPPARWRARSRLTQL